MKSKKELTFNNEFLSLPNNKNSRMQITANWDNFQNELAEIIKLSVFNNQIDCLFTVFQESIRRKSRQAHGGGQNAWILNARSELPGKHIPRNRVIPVPPKKERPAGFNTECFGMKFFPQNTLWPQKENLSAFRLRKNCKWLFSLDTDMACRYSIGRRGTGSVSALSLRIASA